MQNRFTKTRDAHPLDTLASGNGHTRIESYGTVRITLQLESGTTTIDLLEIAFVPEFLTNIVAYNKIKAKGVHMDSRRNRLKRDGTTFCLLPKSGGHILIKDNTSTLPTIVDCSQQVYVTNKPSTPSIARSASDWHKVLEHASAEAISHLPASTEGVELTKNGTPVPQTH